MQKSTNLIYERDVYEELALAWENKNPVIIGWFNSYKKSEFAVQTDEIEDALLRISDEDLTKLYNNVKE